MGNRWVWSAGLLMSWRWCGRRATQGVAGTRIPQSLCMRLLKEMKYSFRREELGQHSRIPGVQGPQREPREHCVWPISHQVRKGNGGTCHSQWLRTWQIWEWPRSGALSLPLSSSVQISTWFQDWIWDAFVIDKSQNFASASGTTLGASYTFMLLSSSVLACL